MTTQSERAIVTPPVPDQAVTIARSETQCKYRHCSRTIQISKGHRRREYCDDLCKQAEHRAREEDKERARVEVQRSAEDAHEKADIQHRYGPDLSEQTVILLRSIWHRYGTALLDEVGMAIHRECEPLRTAQSLDMAQHNKLKAAYHEALLTIAAREDKIEKQRNRIDKQQNQLQSKQKTLEGLSEELAHAQNALLRGGTASLAIPNRDTLEARYMALGEGLHYRLLIQPIHINPGVESWQAFLQSKPDDDTLREVCNIAEHFYANLKVLGIVP